MTANKVLPYGRQFVDDDDIAAVVAQLRSDWLTQGPTVGMFEEALCQITGARYAVAVSSGTAALHLACLAAGMTADDTALVPDITFVATANAVRYCGGRPVLVDIDAETALLTPDAVEGELSHHARARARPKIILPVSFAGSPADLERIRPMADKVGARIIEDAAHSLGATCSAGGTVWRSASCVHSDMAILSFHPVKHLTTGEGGAITTNDAKLYEALCDLRTHGVTKDPARLEVNEGPWYYEQQALGFNYRLTDIESALGLSQCNKFPRFLERRRAIASRYDVAFGPMRAYLKPLRVPEGVASAYHLYVARVVPKPEDSLAEVAARRKALFIYLREHDISPQVHYIPVHRQPNFREAGLGQGTFPGADAYYAGCLSLPMFPAMSDADVDRVVATVDGFFKSRG
jgi:perosamine synthetase